MSNATPSPLPAAAVRVLQHLVEQHVPELAESLHIAYGCSPSELLLTRRFAHGASVSRRLTLPVAIPALITGLHALQQAQADQIALGQRWLLDMDARTLTHPDTVPVHLTEREAALLQFLSAQGSAITSRETLMEKVWGYDARVSSHTIETHIYRLRQKLEALHPPPCTLSTREGGYVLSLA